MKEIYVSKKILKWDVNISGSIIGDDKIRSRPYEMVEHAEMLISKGASELNMSDAIGNLKRALNHRLKAIEKYYKLKDIKFTNSPSGYLELLEEYGLAKPFIIKRLMEIRNRIEHDDTPPPTRARCKELIDITWYFLKSTDRLVLHIASDVHLEPHNSSGLSEKYWCSINLNEGKLIGMNGWVPITYIVYEKRNDFLKMTCDTLHDGEYWQNKDEEYHKDKTKDDIWFIGEFFLDDNDKKMILKKCFEAH